jgi:hypothetical protein
MTELGVYILGATALALLGATGLVEGNHVAATSAVVASGSAYLSQIGAANTAEGAGIASRWINAIFMIGALGSWAFGVWSLL